MANATRKPAGDPIPRHHHATRTKPADCEFLEYDPRSGTVRYRDDRRFGDRIDHSVWTELRSA